MRILIIEDEDFASERLEDLLKEVAPGHRIVGRLPSVKESVRWLKEHSADLIFLDIQLSDGLSFSIFDEVEVTTPVIFTTAYDQHAVRAFELNSIAYLLKPVQKAALKKSLDKLSSLRSGFGSDLRELLSDLKSKSSYKQRFLIRIGEQLKTVSVEEIAYFYAKDKAVYLRTFEGKRYPVEFTLDELGEKLDPATFFRINRGYLININSVEQMYAWSRSRIKLELSPPPIGDSDTVVSIQRTPDFKEWMGS